MQPKAKSNGSILCHIDNVPVEFLIDSGASINTVTEDVWNVLNEKNANIFKKKFECDRRFHAYASSEPLDVLAIFEAWIHINPSKPNTYAEFFVVKEARKCLLSKRTSEELRVLKVGLDVLHVDTNLKPFPRFPGILVKLAIDQTIPPKKLAYLRVPAAMEKKVNKIDNWSIIMIIKLCCTIRLTIKSKRCCSQMSSRELKALRNGYPLW